MNLSPDGTSILDCREIVERLEVTEGFLGVGDDLLTTLVASLDIGEQKI